MRKVSAAIITLLVMTGLLAAMSPALAASSEESGFLSRTNAERTARGIKSVVLDANLSDVARRHSQEMANQNDLHHNDNLGNEVDGWEELDENVGRGPSVDAIHNAFMDSSVHRAGILGNYEKVGIGTAWKDGVLWVTEVFYRAKKSSTSTTTSRPRSTSTSPKTPVAPRTTATRPRVAPSRPAAPVPATAPSAPAPATPPAGVALPVLSSGRIEKLLGDLFIQGPSDDAAAQSDPGVASTPLGSLLWRYVEEPDA